MNSFSWLHLSDLHISDDNPADRDHFENLLDDIRNKRAEKAINPDAIFFTGDVAFSGQKEQYSIAVSWFDELLDACGLRGHRERFFVVPGNHDVDRGVVTVSKMQLWFHEQQAARLLYSDNNEATDEFLSAESDREWAFVKLKNFWDFTSEFFRDEKSAFNHNRYFSVRCLQEKGVVVIALNSAWLSFRDDEQGRLLLGEKQAADALREARNMCPEARLCIAMIHHPLYWLAEKDIHRVEPRLLAGCNVLLRGHLHCSSFSVQSTPDAHLHSFAAGASMKANYHAYNMVRLDLDSGEGRAVVRLQLNDMGMNWGDDTLTYRHAENGEIRFSLKLGEQLWPANGSPA